MKRVLITGATGFIGKRVVKLIGKHFNKSEILCLVWDNNSEIEKQGREVIKKAGLDMRRVDLVTKRGLKNLPKSLKVIIHLAANTDTSTTHHKANDVGTKNLFKALGRLNAKTHVIYTSTTVFMSGRIDCTKPIDESTPAAPSNEYGRSKLRVDQWLKKYCEHHNYRLTILKLNTVYGPNSRPKSMFRLLPKAARKKSLFARLNWPGLTSLVHIDDVAKAIMYFASQKRKKPGKPETYILQGESLSFSRICELVHQGVGVEYQPINVPDILWATAKKVRIYIPYLEKMMPQYFYNYFWRANLLVDDVINCKTDKIKKGYPIWKPKKLEKTVNTVVDSSLISGELL